MIPVAEALERCIEDRADNVNRCEELIDDAIIYEFNPTELTVTLPNEVQTLLRDIIVFNVISDMYREGGWNLLRRQSGINETELYLQGVKREPEDK